MMPGENQSGAGEVASEATSGTCQNCTVLNQSLDEYVAALLTLKQKIIDTDLLLSEYKEKCDELQKSQRESTKLHKELDEVLLKLGPLEKQTAEYEAVRAELQETTAALKVYQVKSEEVDGLREENLKALAVNAKLEESLKKAEDAANTQSLENSKLTAEKKLLESDLQTTRESLRLSQKAVEEAEGLKLQNAKSLILKSNLENQLLALEDINLKQNHTIQELKNKNSNLEKSNRLIEEKYATMEREFNKEKSCASTQTENEPKVDKAKIWTLLQEVWHCVDPLSKTAETLGSNDNHRLTFRPPRSPCPLSVSPFRKQLPQSPVSSPKEAKVSPETSKSVSLLVTPSSPITDQQTRRIGRKKKRSPESKDLNESCTKTDEASDSSPNKDGPVDCLLKEESCRKTPDIWEILSLSHPLPAPISPLPPDELDEMEIDSSLRECSHSKAEEGQKPQSTEPKPLEDSVAVSSPVSSDTDNKSLRKVSTKSQETHVENMCKIMESTDESPCTVATASVPNESDGECVSVNPVTVLSTSEERTDQINGKSLCNGGHEVLRDADSMDGVGQGLEPVQPVTLTEESLEKDDKSVQHHSEVQACVPANSSPQTCSKTEPERTEEEIQSVLTLQSNTGLNSSGGQHSESSSTILNEVTSGDSSDEEEFLGLKRKVRGNCLRPGNLDGVNSDNSVSNETQECVDDVQGTPSEAKEEHHQLEKEKDDGHVSDSSITVNMCRPVILEDIDVMQETGLANKHQDESENCLNNSLPNLDAHSQQENGVLSRSFSPNTENMNGCLKEDGSTPKDPNNKSEDICPASSVNMLTPSILDNTVNLPLTKVASRNALTSPLSPESISKVLTEMGPPLPPVVLPLTATPPKFKRHLIQNRPSIQLPTWSSTEGPFSFNHQSKAPSPDSGLQEELKTPLSTTTPSPSRGVPSSPLQFGSATPKHALPVPGRLPSSALNSSSPSASQENSMQMLDTMYPELSAQARTLNILRGNVNLGRAANERGVSPPPINPISGNKTINSSSTAFTKTDQKAKRIGANVLLPKSAKRLRLDTCSPDPSSLPLSGGVNDDKPSNGVASPTYSAVNGQSSSSPTAGKESKAVGDANDTQSLIFSAFEKLETSCFDVLPVIKSHVFLGRISDIPVLRDEEKCVISDFCSNQSLAEELMLAVLSKIKEEALGMKRELLQSYCRVYVGLCRWRGDRQKAHALAYSLLKEDFPEAPKLILFMVTTWPTLLSHDSYLCRAIHTVSKLKAEGETLDYLSKYLHWDETPPGDIHKMITSILKALREDSTLTFQKHDRHGDDLCPASWEYIVSLDLLCAHLGWKWTHDNIIGKELWPVMNAWVTQPRSEQTPVRDICVAAVLRLIGRLGQLGLKEKLCMSVQNVAKAINLFGKHGISEGVPWEVQLSAVYTIYDLAPSNPKEALEALASWRGEIRELVPPAVTSCLTQIGSLCRQLKQ